MSKFEFEITVNDPTAGSLKNELLCFFYEDDDEYQDSKFNLINANGNDAKFTYKLPPGYTKQDAAEYIEYLFSGLFSQFEILSVKGC